MIQLRKFKVGDRIRVVNYREPADWGVCDNLEATIIYTENNPGFDEQSILVEFYKDVSGHDGEGRGKDYHCWWLSSKQIEHVTVKIDEQEMEKFL